MWNLGPICSYTVLHQWHHIHTLVPHVKAVKAVNNKHIVRNMQAITTFFVKSDNFKRPKFSCTKYQVSINSHIECFETKQYSKSFQHSTIT